MECEWELGNGNVNESGAWNRMKMGMECEWELENGIELEWGM